MKEIFLAYATSLNAEMELGQNLVGFSPDQQKAKLYSDRYGAKNFNGERAPGKTRVVLIDEAEENLFNDKTDHIYLIPDTDWNSSFSDIVTYDFRNVAMVSKESADKAAKELYDRRSIPEIARRAPVLVKLIS